MAEIRIYEIKRQQLGELLREADNPEGATLLIPTLQRPFVWTPSQVTLLIDSLLRGWPFATLLLWEIHTDKSGEAIPARQFWQVTDRTPKKDSTPVRQANPPARYRMVLDGQQRLQSLILAVGGDNYGFRLPDHDWFDVLGKGERRTKANRESWSLGELCLDLPECIAEFEKAEESISAIDFRSVLQWVVRDPKSGLSQPRPAHTYKVPLKTAWETAGKFLSFGRLWRNLPNPDVTGEPKARREIQKLMDENSVEPALRDRAEKVLVALARTIGNVKTTDISFLELRAYDPGIMDADRYNDAVVNIFTRLNAAGRVLTEQEITFAWIKSRWDRKKPDGPDAETNFRQLLDSLKDQGLELETDQLIRMFSILWAMVKNDGALLSRKDLLRPEKIGPLADWLVDQFSQIEKNLRDGAEAVKKTGLGFRDHFESLNAIIVVLGWRLLAVEWEALHPLRREALRDEFGKRLEKKIRDHFVRWIAVSQWANLWAGQSNVYLEETVRDLAADARKLASLSAMDDVFQMMEERMTGWCSKWNIPAAEAIDRLQVNRRDLVRQYRLPLWIWHRLTAKRADLSGIALRAGRARVSEDVDHVVAANYWQTHLRASCTKNDEKADAESIPHYLGNCQLLATNFNQSRGDRTFNDFLSEVHEFKSKQITLDEWCRHMKTDPGMMNPKGKTGDEIAKLIEYRTNIIKDELVEFLRGTSNVVLG